MTRHWNLIVIVALSVCASSLFAVSTAGAATMQINAIAPFNTGLGTLTHAVVTIDPLPIDTQPYHTNFSSIGNHTHTLFLPSTTILGLHTFTYAPAISSVGNSNAFTDHDHSIDVAPSVMHFSGGNLGWFLNASNPNTNIINFPPLTTSPSEDHSHAVVGLSVTPRTVFTYTPVPEPASLALFGLGALVITRRRQ